MRLSESEKAVLRKQVAYWDNWDESVSGPLPVDVDARRRLLAELDAMTAERDAYHALYDRMVLQYGFPADASGATPEPSGAPTEYSDTDSGTLDLVERAPKCEECGGQIEPGVHHSTWGYPCWRGTT